MRESGVALDDIRAWDQLFRDVELAKKMVDGASAATLADEAAQRGALVARKC
jgi:hypothetical protein